jgi:hypothetical protein
MGFLVWVLLALSAAVLAIVAGRRRARRRAALIRLADALGLDYAATDIFDERWEPFRLFGKGTARGIENIVYGTVGGIEVRVFDYWYRRGADRDRGAVLPFIAGAAGLAAWIGLTQRFSCAVAGVPGSCPNLVVEPKGIGSHIEELVEPDVPLESEEFTRRFQVRSADPKFAVAFLDPRVMAALLSMPRRPTLQLSEDRMLVVTRQLRAPDVIELYHRTAELARTVPLVLASLYPLRPGFRPEDAPARPRSLQV